jgi:hypothetical protein
MEVKRYDVFASETIVEMKLDVTKNIDHSIIILMNASQIINGLEECDLMCNMRGLTRVQAAIDILQNYEKILSDKVYKKEENYENNTLCSK